MKINMNTANELIRRYRLAKAELEKIDRIEKELTVKALHAGDYRNEDTGERITDPQITYMMSEADYDRFLRARYELECNAWIMDPDGYEYSATRMPAEALKRAEDDMIAYMIDTIPAVYGKEADTLRSVTRNYKWRTQFIDITLRLNVPANRVDV